MADSFVFYRSFMDALRCVPEEEFCTCLKALIVYALDGEDTADTWTSQMFMALAKPQIDANKKRRKNGEKGAEYGKLGGRPKAENAENPIGVTDETPNENANVNEEKEKTRKKEKRFQKPTVEEVQEYCTERHNAVDPQTFVDFYESKGWKVGNSPMKDWKACVRTWERSRNKDAPRSGSDKIRQINQTIGRTGSVKEQNDALIRQILAGGA